MTASATVFYGPSPSILEKEAISANLATRALRSGTQRLLAGNITPARFQKFVGTAQRWLPGQMARTHNEMQARALSHFPQAGKFFGFAQNLPAGVDDAYKGVMRRHMSPDAVMPSQLPKIESRFGGAFDDAYRVGNRGLLSRPLAALGIATSRTGNAYFRTNTRGQLRIGGDKILRDAPTFFHELGHAVDADLGQLRPFETMRNEVAGWRRGSQLYRDWHAALPAAQQATVPTPQQFLQARHAPLETYRLASLENLLQGAHRATRNHFALDALAPLSGQLRGPQGRLVQETNDAIRALRQHNRPPMPRLGASLSSAAGRFAPSVPVKQADLAPGIELQDHQQRIADRISGEDPRLLVYHGLGSGKSLSAIAAAEQAKKEEGGEYGVVVPASLKGNFEKEVAKFTRNSNPEIMSYTGLGMGKDFTNNPDTLIMDEAARLRNPTASSTAAAIRAARKAKRLVLLTGTPITNEPSDIASLLSMLNNQTITPQQFDQQFVSEKKVRPGILAWLRGVKPGTKPVIKNEDKLRALLAGKVDYLPSKTPEGVNVNEEIVRVPLSPAQQKIQKAIRTKIPPGFLWKLDKEFPLSRDELAKLNSFLTGLRQVSLSTQSFRADQDGYKAFTQSSKLQKALADLQETLKSDPRKKAIIYSNFIDAGLKPYAAALEKNKIPHGFFHGSIPLRARQKALKEYNEGKLRALLLGPAAAEGISTKGTSLIQLLDPHWNEARSQQARGRGLRFDSHEGLPEELRNVAVRRYLSASEEPGIFGKYILGKKRERTGDEVLERLTAEKEQFNNVFRDLLREVGQEKQSVADELLGTVMQNVVEEKNPLAHDVEEMSAAKAKKKKKPAPEFKPDFTPEQLEEMGVYDSLYRGIGPRLASLSEWKPEWVNPVDPKGWAQWYKRYSGGRRLGEEDERQIKRWANFKSRHGGPFIKNPTPRRGWALQNWGIDPSLLVSPDQSDKIRTMLHDYAVKQTAKHVANTAAGK